MLTRRTVAINITLATPGPRPRLPRIPTRIAMSHTIRRGADVFESGYHLDHHQRLILGTTWYTVNGRYVSAEDYLIGLLPPPPCFTDPPPAPYPPQDEPR